MRTVVDSPLESPIQDRASFEEVRYGSVWEDADVLCRALGPVAPGGRLLSVASAGDNALALLTLDPREVVAVDLSRAQLACLALRVAAFRVLEDRELPGFLGVEPQEDRLGRYRRLRPALPDFARDFWDARGPALERGAVHAGRFEAYFDLFRTRVLPLIHPRSRVESLFAPRDRDGRRRFHDQQWNTVRWRLLFRIFFGRWVMGRLGRDPEFFRHVDGPVGEVIRCRSVRGLVDLPTRTNPYLVRIMTGAYTPEALPPYLRPELRPLIRRRLDRLTLHHGPVEEAPGTFDGFNLSDIFEYMGPTHHRDTYRALLERARLGARIVYWNLMVPRACPPVFRNRVSPLSELEASLLARDRAFFYGALHVEAVGSL
jgi:S-adenosylmethionine-diacylglycerol 3-amino-3-carboxypropyl transferase